MYGHILINKPQCGYLSWNFIMELHIIQTILQTCVLNSHHGITSPTFSTSIWWKPSATLNTRKWAWIFSYNSNFNFCNSCSKITTKIQKLATWHSMFIDSAILHYMWVKWNYIYQHKQLVLKIHQILILHTLLSCANEKLPKQFCVQRG